MMPFTWQMTATENGPSDYGEGAFLGSVGVAEASAAQYQSDIADINNGILAMNGATGAAQATAAVSDALSGETANATASLNTATPTDTSAATTSAAGFAVTAASDTAAEAGGSSLTSPLIDAGNAFINGARTLIAAVDTAAVAAGVAINTAMVNTSIESGAVESAAVDAFRINSQYVYHYTTAPGALGIAASDMINPSADGFTYVTNTVYTSGRLAQAELAMSSTPAGYFMIPAQNVPGPIMWSLVQQANNQQGGGMQGQVLGPIPATGAVFVPIPR
jgi:hypothetical protein